MSMPAVDPQQAMEDLSQAERRWRMVLVGLAFALLSVILLGLFYLRATPSTTVTAMLGVNAIPGLLPWRARVERAMGWSLIVLGEFILVMGGLYYEWYEESIIHVSWNNLLQRYLGGNLAETMELRWTALSCWNA